MLTLLQSSPSVTVYLEAQLIDGVAEVVVLVAEVAEMVYGGGEVKG